MAIIGGFICQQKSLLILRHVCIYEFKTNCIIAVYVYSYIVLVHLTHPVQIIPKTSREIAEEDNKVFRKEYSRLSAMTDIDNLLKYFVAENIINFEDQEVITVNPRISEKARLLLENISGPLQAGNSKPFRRMLDIMEKHGNKATKELAISIKIHLVKSNGMFNEILSRII